MNDSMCRLCGSEFKSAIVMKNHIIKETDCKHQLLAYIYTELHMPCKEINSYVDKYQQFFDETTEASLTADKENLLAKIQADIKTAKEEQEFAKRQEAEQRKLARHEADLRRLAELEEKRKIEKRLEKDQMESMNVEDRPKALVEEYHNMAQTKCYSYVVEIQIVKGLYTKYKLEPEVAHEVIKYMAKMGYKLTNLNYKIDEAMEFVEAHKQMKEPNTIPYLIRYYYKQMGMKPNFKTFMSEHNRIKSSMLANNLTIEQVKNVIDGMIREKVNILAWFDSKVSRYANVQKKEDPIHNYSDEREIKENIQQILNGKLTVDKVNVNIRTKCVEILRQKYMHGDFDEKYNYFEWAFKIQLPLDKEMFTFGEQHKNERKNRFEQWHKQVMEANDEIYIRCYNSTMEKYNTWLSKYATL